MTTKPARPALTLLMLAGCSHGAAVRATTPALPASTATTTALPHRLQLPRRGVAGERHVPIINRAQGPLSRNVTINLLRHADLPAEYEFTVAPVIDTCGEESGRLVLQALDVPPGAPVAAALDDDVVRIRPLSDGATTLVLRGEYTQGRTTCGRTPPVGSRLPHATTLHIDVTSDPGRVRITRAGRCEAARVARLVRCQTGLPVSLAFEPATGRPETFNNVLRTAPFPVLIESDVDLGGAPDTPDGLRLPSTRAHLAFSSPDTSDHPSVECGVTARDLTAATVRFFVPGQAGATLEVTEGASLSGGNRALRGVYFQVPDATVGDDRLCDDVDARWFTLTTETPDVCDVVPVDPNGLDGPTYLNHGHAAARLLRDGTCTVRVSAPDADGGRGLSQRVTASFTNVAAWMQLASAPAAP